MAVTINASTSTGLVQSADTSGEIELQSNGTTALKVNTNEGIQILNCLGVGNATPSTSGAGITFPATQSASSNANTLDDYEEGTWTPTYYGATTAGTTTYTSQNGSYRKIGDTVFVEAYIQWSAATGTGSAYIGGLPFTANSYSGTNDTRGLTAIGAWNGYSVTGALYIVVSPSTTSCELYAINNGSLSQSSVSNAGSMRLEFFYRV